MGSRFLVAIKNLLVELSKRKRIIIALSAVVVFVTTYMLILPAMTLEHSKALKLGGIDVPASEQTEEASDETAHSDEAQASDAANDAENAPAHEEAQAQKPDDDDKAKNGDSAVSKDSGSKSNDAASKSGAGKTTGDVSLTYECDDYTVAVAGTDAGLHEDMTVEVSEIDRADKKQKKEYDSLYIDALKAVQEEKDGKNVTDFAFAKFYDISLMDGKDSVEPDASVDVKISYEKELRKELAAAAGAIDPARVRIVHFAEDKTTGEITPQVLEAKDTNITVENKQVTEAAFTADSFSVYAVVYTVDFEYEVDGKKFNFSIPGGGFVSLEHVVELLGIANTDTYSENEAKSAENGDKNTIDNAGEVSDISNITTYSAADLNALAISEETRKFVADVESVTFSSPELVWVGKVDSDSTVGGLKEANGLECEYSAELTEAQIAEINARTVEAGDWALISLKPFESEETLTVAMKNGETFTIKVTDSQTTINDAKVHYGYMDGNTFHEFTAEQFTPPTSGFGNKAYLIYDVPGYQYAGKTTHVYTDWWGGQHSDDVPPIIEGNGTGDYYVYYEPRPAATQGGSSSQGGDYPDEPTVLKKSEVNPNTGTNTISLEVSGPRKTTKPKADIIVIYDVSGSMMFPIGFNSLKDVPVGENAQQFFIKNPIDENTTLPGHPEWGGQRNALVVKNLEKLASTLMGSNTGGDPDVRMAIVPFSTQYDGTQFLPFTGDPDTFNTRLNDLSLGGGTNWEDALQTANAMEVREDADTYVLFITDGNPTFRITRLGETDTQLTTEILPDTPSGITDYYYADLGLGIFGTGNSDPDKTSKLSRGNNLSAALAIAQSMAGNNKKLYGLGISDEADELKNLMEDEKVGGQYYSAKTNAGVTSAINDIRQQVLEKTFGYSDVQITDGITALTQTVQKSQLTNLPADDDFEYFKGHEATQADVDAGRATNVGDVIWETWTADQMAKEGAGRATYEGGAVKWNLGEHFMLEEGVHYKVDFTVWPSQEAYDILADLNNGYVREESGALTRYGADGDTAEEAADKAYANLPEDVKKQITKSGGKYILKTNEDSAGYSYRTATKEGDGEAIPNGKPISHKFDPVIPLNLEKDKLNVEKDWKASPIDSQGPEPVDMEVWGGSKLFGSKLFKELKMSPTEIKEGSSVPNSGKSGDIYISCGLLKVDNSSGKVVVYETGRDFSLREVGEASRHWDLESDTLHPMVINNQETMLLLVEGEDIPDAMKNNAELAYCSSGGADYYRIEGKVYKDAKGTVDLYGLNTRRSSLDLAKEVLIDGNVTEQTVDTKFTYKIKIDVDPTILDWDHDLEQYVAISVRGDETPDQMKADAQYPTTAYLPSQCGYSDADYPGYLMAKSGEEFYLSIKNGWSIRFMNLPVGTTYSIEEVLPAGSEYNFVEGRFEVTKEKGAEPTVSKFKRKKLTGTITDTSTLYKAVYQNTQGEVPPSGALKITKAVTVDGNAPTDANKSFTDGTYEFEVKGVNGTETEGINHQVKITFENGKAVSYQIDDEDTVSITDAEGNSGDVILDGLKPGQYTVEETGKGALKLTTVNVTEGTGNSVTSKIATVTVEEGEENTVQASFTNNAETTSLTVQKTWSDVVSSHSSDTVTYHLFQVPYVGTAEYQEQEITTAAGFTGHLSAGNSWKETITGLPKSGMYTPAGGDPIVVSYRYYVTEDLFGTYTPVIKETPEGSGNWIINNVAPDSQDKNTSVEFTKAWQTADGQPDTDPHEDDTITVKLTQTAVDSGYVPVTIILINGNESEYSNKTIYIQKGNSFTLTANKTNSGRNHSVTVTARGSASGTGSKTGNQYGPNVFKYTNVSGELNIRAKLNYYYDKWGNSSDASDDYTWGHYTTSPGSPKTSVEAVVSSTAENTVAVTQELTYTFKSGELNGQYSTSAKGWKGIVAELPLYKKINDTTYYAYSYTVDEIAINGVPVMDGQTSDYTVTVGDSTYDTDANKTTAQITNKKKPGINLTVRKVAKADVSDMSADTLPGATFVLEKYTDSHYQNKDSAWTEQTAADSDNTTSGVFSFANLSEGYYQLVETVSPTGYIKTESNPRFHVKPEGTTLKVYIINSSGEEVEATDMLKVENTTINVGNEPGAELPHTGGIGTTFFYIFGTLFVITCAATLALRRRTKASRG